MKSLGKKFIVKKNVNLPDKAYQELGESFIKIINGEDVHFSKDLKKFLHVALSSSSIINYSSNTVPACNLSFLNGLSNSNGEKQILKQIESEENEIEAKLLAAMRPDTTQTFGFHQLRIILQVANETISPSGLSEKECKKIDYRIFSQLKDPNANPDGLIKEAKSSLDQASALLVAFDANEYKKTQSS